jgi:hypothetical protein
MAMLTSYVSKTQSSQSRLTKVYQQQRKENYSADRGITAIPMCLPLHEGGNLDFIK